MFDGSGDEREDRSASADGLDVVDRGSSSEEEAVAAPQPASEQGRSARARNVGGQKHMRDFFTGVGLDEAVRQESEPAAAQKKPRGRSAGAKTAIQTRNGGVLQPLQKKALVVGMELYALYDGDLGQKDFYEATLVRVENRPGSGTLYTVQWKDNGTEESGLKLKHEEICASRRAIVICSSSRQR